MINNSNRKYKLTIISMIIVLIGFASTTINNTLANAYSELITGIISLLVVYCGGNVGNKFILGRGEKIKNAAVTQRDT